MEPPQQHGKAGTGLRFPYIVSYDAKQRLAVSGLSRRVQTFSLLLKPSSSLYCPQRCSCHYKDTLQTPSSLWFMVSPGWFSMAAYSCITMCAFSFVPSCRICTFTHSSISRLSSNRFYRPLCTPALQCTHYCFAVVSSCLRPPPTHHPVH